MGEPKAPTRTKFGVTAAPQIKPRSLFWAEPRSAQYAPSIATGMTKITSYGKNSSVSRALAAKGFLAKGRKHLRGGNWLYVRNIRDCGMAFGIELRRVLCRSRPTGRYATRPPSVLDTTDICRHNFRR